MFLCSDVNNNRRFCYFFLLSLMLVTFVTACKDDAVKLSQDQADNLNPVSSWKQYRGAWFTIDYPANFVVQPSLLSDDPAQYDSVFFVAANKQVSFYVLAPQWRRNASDITIQPDAEKSGNLQQQTTVDSIHSSRLIQARDNSYQRIIETISSADQTSSYSFQFYYTTQLAKQRYLDEYRRFKKSLTLYSD